MVTAITGLIGTAAGAALGSTPADVAQGRLNAKNAMENNALSDREIITEGKRIDEICKTSNNLARCWLNEISKLIPHSDAKSHLSEAKIQLIGNIENQALQEALSICKFNHECINNAEQEFIYARLHCDTAACMKEQGNIIIRAISFKYENILGRGLRVFNDFSPVLPVTSMVGKTTRIKPISPEQVPSPIIRTQPVPRPNANPNGFTASFKSAPNPSATRPPTITFNQPLAASSRWNGAWRNGNWNAGVNNARPADAGRAARQIAKQTEASQQLKGPTELQNARNDLYSVLHQLQLGADPAKGQLGRWKFSLDEVLTGTRLEQQLGVKLQRYGGRGEGDWRTLSGKVLDAASPPPSHYFNDRSFIQWQESIRSHLNKQGVDTIVVDPVQRGLNPIQTKQVVDFINTLLKNQRDRIIILK